MLLRATARALGLPLPVVATALVYMHRCRCSGHPWALSATDMVCGCLYAAAKAEEVRSSHINWRLLSLPHARRPETQLRMHALSGEHRERRRAAAFTTAVPHTRLHPPQAQMSTNQAINLARLLALPENRGLLEVGASTVWSGACIGAVAGHAALHAWRRKLVKA